MVKIGTLKDFRDARKKLEEQGHKVDVVSGELVRKLKVRGETVLSIARLRGSTWSFRYSKIWWGE